MKTTQTSGVRFIALPKKSNSNEAFIYARITVSKKVIDISLKRTVLYSLWDSKKECISSKTPEAKQLNEFIDDTLYRLMECHQQLILEHLVIALMRLKHYLGETKRRGNHIQQMLRNQKELIEQFNEVRQLNPKLSKPVF